MDQEGKWSDFQEFQGSPFTIQEGKCSEFQDLQEFPFMIRQGKCSDFQDAQGFPFMNQEGKSAFGGFPPFTWGEKSPPRERQCGNGEIGARARVPEG